MDARGGIGGSLQGSTCAPRSTGCARSATPSSSRIITRSRKSRTSPISSATASIFEPQGAGDRCRRDRLLRRPLHGRDREDPVAREDRRAARHGCRLLAGGQLPARSVRRLPRRASRSYRADLHQLLGRGEGAVSDIIVTSCSAEKILSQIPPEQKIIFGPDKHLGGYLAARPGATCCSGRACASSTRRSAKPSCSSCKAQYPGAPVAAHPECPPHILDHADYVGSTSGILEFAKNFARRHDDRRDRAAHHPPDGKGGAGQDTSSARPARTATATATSARTWRSTRWRSSTSRCAIWSRASRSRKGCACAPRRASMRCWRWPARRLEWAISVRRG